MKKRQIIIMAIVLLSALGMVFITEQKKQKTDDEQKTYIFAELDTQNVNADEKEMENQVTNTEKKTEEKTEENTEENAEDDAEDDARALQCMEEYLEKLEEKDTYFALKDVNRDGVDELLYRHDEDYVSYLTVLGYMQGQLYAILNLEYAQYSSEIALCNGNELTLVQSLSDAQTVSYYRMNGIEYDLKTINVEADYEEDIFYNYFIDGEECSREEFNYYNVNVSDWLNFNGQYPEERYVKSVERFIFHENTEEGRKSIFENQICFSEYDTAVLKNLIGIIGYMENEGQYTTGSEMSPQEWSDEAKLEFMDYLIASGLIDDCIVTSYIDTEQLEQQELNLLFDYSYYAMCVDDMNCILENVIGVRVDGQLNTKLAIYYNGYYIFCVGQFVEWIPYSEIVDEPVLSENVQNYIVYAETGIGLLDDNENTEIPYTLEGNDIRHFRDVYVKKNNGSVCATIQITGWSEDTPVEFPYNEQ